MATPHTSLRSPHYPSLLLFFKLSTFMPSSFILYDFVMWPVSPLSATPAFTGTQPVRSLRKMGQDVPRCGLCGTSDNLFWILISSKLRLGSHAQLLVPMSPSFQLRKLASWSPEKARALSSTLTLTFLSLNSKMSIYPY